MSVALVFPGQGAQSVRMGRAPARHAAAARAVFVPVDASPLGDARPPSPLLSDDPSSEFTLTASIQLAPLAVGAVCLRALSAGRATEASYV